MLITYKQSRFKFFSSYLVVLDANNLDSEEINELNRIVTVVVVFLNGCCLFGFELFINYLFDKKNTKGNEKK